MNECNKVTGSDINNNSNNDLSVSTRPTSFQKKFRKDAKGNLILKKKMQIKKTKHHIYFIDKINPKKDLVTIIDIESYKKYNLENEEEIETISRRFKYCYNSWMLCNSLIGFFKILIWISRKLYIFIILFYL